MKLLTFSLIFLIGFWAAPAVGQSTVEVPVLSRTLSADDVVGAGDIAWTKVPARQVRGDVVTAAEDIIGLSPRRRVSADRPVRLSEFMKPLAVKKGTLVTLALTSGALSLTTRGRVLEDGAIGDTVRVINLTSNRTVQGEVAADGLVEVPAPRGVGTVAFNAQGR